MTQHSSFSSQHIRTFWWGAGTFFCGLLLTYLVSLYQQNTQKQELQDLLNKETQILVGQTQRRINLYITTLRSGAEVLDKGHFETFAERFLLFCQSQRFQNANTGINEIGFIPALTINPPTPQNVISQLCSVQDGVLIKYNTEQPVNPALFKILFQPVGEGQVIASPYFKLTFRPSSPESEGQIFYYPIGNYDPTSKTKMVGNPKLVGWLFLTLRKSFFADRLRLEHNPDLQVRLEMMGSTSFPDTLIYESSTDALKDKAASGAFLIESSIPVAGRIWKLTTGFSRAYVSEYVRAGRGSLWVAGFALSLLAGVLVAFLRVRYQKQAESQMADYESELIELNRSDADQDQPVIASQPLTSNSEKGEESVVEDFDIKSFVTELGDSSQFSQDELWAMASIDPVTELPNRLLFMDRLALELRRAKRDNHLFGLLIFSVDHFSEIQSGYGNKVADQVLKVIAGKTQMLLRSTDTVGYLADNQYGVLIAQQHDIQHLTRIAYKVYENQASKIDAGGHKIPTTISLGLSIYPEDGVESGALIENALYALNESKKQGGDRLTFYSQPLEEATGQRRVLVQEIRKAIDSKQLFVRFQPVIDLDTGTVAKAEALIRWENPEKGEIKPQEFIDIAEDAGLIVEIGNFVFTETVNYLRKWKKILPADFQVSINISPQQLRLSKELAKEWRAILLEKEVLGQSIVLEITEGILLQDDRQIIQSIYELREAGIRFCLDDFGTGYSSISYLKKLDIDYLKVDQSFVRDLNSNEEDQKIVEGILLLAKKMGMKSIAEGVETKDQLNCLREFGCEYGQGFYFARAMTPDEFIEWAKERFN